MTLRSVTPAQRDCVSSPLSRCCSPCSTERAVWPMLMLQRPRQASAVLHHDGIDISVWRCVA
jgi:hypothetical protein